MAMPWFYMPQLPMEGSTAALSPREARHASGSRRLLKGDNVCVFDGKGGVAESEITHIANREVMIRCRATVQHDPPTRQVHVASALPKGDRQNFMLSMATQLGMTSFAPLQCARNIAQPGKAFIERTQRICIEACKQSHRPFLPVVHSTISIGQAAQQASDMVVAIAHPGGQRDATVLAGNHDVRLLVGPEGGFTDNEIQTAVEAGATLVDLCDGILRTETAVVAMLAWCAFTGQCHSER